MSVEVTRLPSGLVVITDAMAHLAACQNRRLAGRFENARRLERQATESSRFARPFHARPVSPCPRSEPGVRHPAPAALGSPCRRPDYRDTETRRR